MARSFAEITNSPARKSKIAFNPRAVLIILPVMVFWIVRQFAAPEVAIASGFLASLVVFFLNRKRGAAGVLSILIMIVIGGAAIVGIVLGNEKAYLASDPISDFMMLGIALGSVIIGKPLFGILAKEIVPTVEQFLERDHSVFFLTTWLWILVNVIQGTSRLLLLQNLSVDQYLLFSRVVSWPLNILLLFVAYHLIDRAMKKARYEKDASLLRG